MNENVAPVVIDLNVGFTTVSAPKQQVPELFLCFREHVFVVVQYPLFIMGGWATTWNRQFCLQKGVWEHAVLWFPCSRFKIAIKSI